MGDVWYSRVRAVADDGQRGTARSDWFVLDPLRVGLEIHPAELYPGWNLLAFPVEPVDDFVTEYTDEATVEGLLGKYILDPAWAWDATAGSDGDYVALVDGVGEKSPIMPMHGFWVFHEDDADREPRTATEVFVLGWPIGRQVGDDTVELSPGWNLFGVAADFAEPPDWASNPRISWPVWAWENDILGDKYRLVSYPDDRLKAGQGFWIYLHGDTPLTIDVSPE